MTTTPRRVASANPWLNALALLGPAVAAVGLLLVAGNGDATDPTYDPATAATGNSLLAAGAALLAGWLVAGAICWQLRRR